MSVLFFSNCHTDPAISAASSSHHNHRNMPVRVLENTAAPSSQVSGNNNNNKFLIFSVPFSIFWYLNFPPFFFLW